MIRRAVDAVVLLFVASWAFDALVCACRLWLSLRSVPVRAPARPVDIPAVLRDLD